MQILLKFVTDNPNFPLDYRSTFLSFFKKSLSIFENGKWVESFYMGNRRKPFTFAVNLPSAKFLKEYIILGKNEIKLTISTPDSFLGYLFLCAFELQIDQPFAVACKNKIILRKVLVLRNNCVNNNKMIIKMESPLCLREHDKTTNKDFYYSVASEKFNEQCKRVLKAQMLADGISEHLAESVKVTPINCKKTVVLHYGTYIECSLGVFKIEADNTILSYFLQTGLGSRKSEGFGFAKLISNFD